MAARIAKRLALAVLGMFASLALSDTQAAFITSISDTSFQLGYFAPREKSNPDDLMDRDILNFDTKTQLVTDFVFTSLPNLNYNQRKFDPETFSRRLPHLLPASDDVKDFTNFNVNHLQGNLTGAPQEADGISQADAASETVTVANQPELEPEVEIDIYKSDAKLRDKPSGAPVSNELSDPSDKTAVEELMKWAYKTYRRAGTVEKFAAIAGVIIFLGLLAKMFETRA